MKTSLKSIAAICAPLLALFSAAGATAGMALADWTPNDIASSSGLSGVGVSVKAIDASTISGWLNTAVFWVLGIVVVLFVAKIVLWAIVSMFSEGQDKGGGGSSWAKTLTSLPVIGTPAGTKIGTILLQFGKYLLIIACAWVLITVIMNLVLMASGFISNTTA